MKKILLTSLILIPMLISAQTTEFKMPKIVGIAHFALYTDDLQVAADLYTDYLGYGEPYYVTTGRSATPNMMFIKINDHQYVEFFKDDANRLVKYRHTAFETEDVEAMRLYLKSKGLEVPDSVTDSGFGFKSFFTYDFNGHEIEFLEYTGDGFIGEMWGKNMPDTRISDDFRHVGWTCPDSAKDIAFYGYILGFKEFWRGGEKPDQINWIKMQIPDSHNYIELMLFDHDLNQEELGLYSHMDVDMESVQAAKEILDGRKLPKGCRPAGNQSTGICGYGLSNVYLPDGTRCELMTDVAVSGTPSPSTYGKPLRYDGDFTHLLYKK